MLKLQILVLTLLFCVSFMSCYHESESSSEEDDECAPRVCKSDEQYSECEGNCEPSCNNRNPICPAVGTSGCICKKGLFRQDGKCVKACDCRQRERCLKENNEKFSECRYICPPQTCNSLVRSYDCAKLNKKCEPGCDCIDDYLRNGTEFDACIPSDQCPSLSQPEPEHQDGEEECSDGCLKKKNEKFSECRILCPPQTCNSIARSFDCTKINKKCEPGCDCIDGYLRNGTEFDACIPSDQCPSLSPTLECGENEYYTPVAGKCEQSCATLGQAVSCIQGGEACYCKDGFARSSDNKCIRVDQCPRNCGKNEKLTTCRIKCPPQTCQSKLAMWKCAVPIKCESGCDCIPGYLRNGSAIDGPCIPSDQCFPKPDCKDPNAENVKCATNRCTPTCDNPDPYNCQERCVLNGCQCKQGFILSHKEGKCIKPDTCPGGNPCGANGTYSNCAIDCPTNYCPVDDRRGTIACDQPNPCRGGCYCKLNHRKLSVEDRRCIATAECPIVKCTRPNEEWHSCTQGCYQEGCEHSKKKYQCYEFVFNCVPRCLCIKGHFRNARGECIPASECP